MFHNYVLSTPTFPNASATSGKFIRSDGTNWIASTPTLPTTAGTSGKILQSDGTNYVESTPTYPSTSGTARKIIVSDGTNNVYSTETWATPGTSGNVLTSNGTNWTSAAPTASVPYVNIQISGSSGAFSGSSATFATVTNLTVTITTLGGPVKLSLEADGNTTNTSYLTGTGDNLLGAFFRGVTQLSYQICAPNGVAASTSGVNFTDNPAAGTYTYTFQYKTGGVIGVNYARLVAVEV